MAVETKVKKEATVYSSADSTLEVSLHEVTTEKDGRGFRGRKSKEYTKFTLTVEEAAALVRELAVALAYGYRRLAEGVPEEKW